MSHFRLQITDKDGNAVRLIPGAKEERDFVEAIVSKVQHLQADDLANAIASHGVGWFKSEAQVRAAITAVIGKADAEIRHAIEQTFYEAKAEVVPE